MNEKTTDQPIAGRIKPNVGMCAYCTWTTPMTTDRQQIDDWRREHVEKFCPHHPLRRLEGSISAMSARIDASLDLLNGGVITEEARKNKIRALLHEALAHRPEGLLMVAS